MTRKSIIVSLITLTIMALLLTAVQAAAFGPDEDLLKSWLSGKEIVIGKKWFGLRDHREKIKDYLIKEFNVVEYSEPGNWQGYIPFLEAKKSGVALANFSYVFEQKEFKYSAFFLYYWKYKGIGIKRDFVAVITTPADARP
jgi:hypothetical protein